MKTMFNYVRPLSVGLLSIMALILLTGCASYLKRKELEAVARDWCMVVRASQVLPVYPLTEDVQPGDIFMVTTPIGKEADLYSSRGFLPLDQHLARLQPLDYSDFYQSSYKIGTNRNTPHHWQFPLISNNQTNRGTVPPSATSTNATRRHLSDTDWQYAPRAAFPTYTFSVKSGAGAKLALPVQGVSVALGFLKSGAASGTVTISDSYVYGVSFEELEGRLRDWVEMPSRRAWLADVRKGAQKPVYIRIVNRVYLTGGVVLSLQHQGSMGGSASAGKAKEVELLEKGDEGAATNYVRVLDVINKKIDDSLPGGTVKFVQATERSVTMNETFDRPLVIGYIAFDFPVMPDGSLGAPIATQERLAREIEPETRIGELNDAQLELRMLIQAVNASGEKDAIYKEAAANLGEDFKVEFDKAAQGGVAVGGAFSDARLEYMKTKGTDAASAVYRALFAAWKNNQGL